MTHLVAHNILAQLGGNRFVTMTGASNLTSREDGLSFKIGSNPKLHHAYHASRSPAMDDYIVRVSVDPRHHG